jgi:hypothetical protein
MFISFTCRVSKDLLFGVRAPEGRYWMIFMFVSLSCGAYVYFSSLVHVKHITRIQFQRLVLCGSNSRAR